MPSVRSARHGLVCLVIGLITWAVFAQSSATVFAQTAQPASYPVGMKQMEYVDPADGHHVAFALFYPAAPPENATPLRMTFFTNLTLYWDAPVAPDGAKHPLILLSHGRGSNGPYYAWLCEYLASRGYIVAALYHYRANSYDGTVMYLASKLWQRPRDISLAITFLLEDKLWGPHIDESRVGVAGHSQGGFTALWVGGATVNPEKYLRFQRVWRDNRMVPAYLRKDLPLDAAPALEVHDERVKAVFAMAPGDLPAFGMDEAGLRRLKVPTYIIVGARDTQASPRDNAEFAAKHVAHAELDVMPGLVDHEIFVNQCDEVGRDAWPEACIDAPGVDRAKWHQYIGEAAVRFFDSSLSVQRKRVELSGRRCLLNAATAARRTHWVRGTSPIRTRQGCPAAFSR